MNKFINALTELFICTFLGHKKDKNNKCLRCKQQFGVPKLTNPPKAPDINISLTDYFNQMSKVLEGTQPNAKNS